MQRVRRAAGFSLIEVIFSIAILGLGIVGILSLFTTGISRATWAQNVTSASMEVQSLVTRILTLSDNAKPPHRIVLDYIHKSTDAPGSNANQWIQFDENTKFSGGPAPVLIDSKRDFYWKCRCKPVHADHDAKGNVVDWYPPLSPDDPFDSSGAPYQDKSVSSTYVNGLYEIAIAVYKSTDGSDLATRKPIAVYTTLITAGY